MTSSPRVYSRIVGTGSALPERLVDNATLAAEPHVRKALDAITKP